MLAGGLLLSCAKTPMDDHALEVTDNEFVPIELPVETRSFVDGGNAFAFKLLQQVEARKEGENFMISPLSVSMAFGLLIEAAEDGPALDEVTGVLGYGKGRREDIRSYCSTIMKRFPEMDKLSKVAIANLVLTNSDFGKTNPAFEGMALSYYDALVKNLSFGKPKVIVDEVNAWAKEKTDGMIPEAVRESDIKKQTTAVLANALYFNGKWANRFLESDTEREDFTLESGKKVKVDMMKQTGMFFVTGNGEGSVLQMPYGNGAFVMTVFLPGEKNSVRQMIASLAGNPQGAGQGCVQREVSVWFPKFKLSPQRTDLEEILYEMGMKEAFSPMNGWLDLLQDTTGPESSIEKVFQTAAIEVSESGTEAAAVTVITARLTSAFPSGSAEFHVDHPFVYTITESSTGAILFAGVYRGA